MQCGLTEIAELHHQWQKFKQQAEKRGKTVATTGAHLQSQTCCVLLLLAFSEALSCAVLVLTVWAGCMYPDKMPKNLSDKKKAALVEKHRLPKALVQPSP